MTQRDRQSKLTTVRSPETAESTAKPQADRRITLRFKRSEWAIIESDIAATGLNQNAYFRELALDAPVPRRARQRSGGVDAKTAAKFVGQLGKLGSNLNQLAKQANIACKTGEWATMPSAKAISENVAAANELLLSIREELKVVKRPDQHGDSWEN